MVFDRRFNAASPRYLGSASNAQQQNDGLRPPLQDHCVLLTRSFLMVLGGCRVWTGDLGNRTVQKDGLQVELRLERNSCPGTRCYPWTKKPDFSPMSAPA